MTSLLEPAFRRGPIPDGAVRRVSTLPRLAVVIPARNEERRLPRCLAAVVRADASLRAARPAAWPTRVVVVLDRCTDRSRELLAGWPTVEVVTSEHGQVGAARSMGVDHALGVTGPGPTAGWIACTDADSAVPADWLLTHLAHAVSGTDLLLGLVRPDPAELAPEMLHSWTRAHRLTDGHPHVHGANLGIGADMYRRAGGFPSVPEHEDVLLAARVRELGGRVVSTASSPVLTSARTTGRTPAGMAGYLAGLAERRLDPGSQGRSRQPPRHAAGQSVGTSDFEFAS